VPCLGAQQTSQVQTEETEAAGAEQLPTVQQMAAGPVILVLHCRFPSGEYRPNANARVVIAMKGRRGPLFMIPLKFTRGKLFTFFVLWGAAFRAMASKLDATQPRGA
jgi:hypothetical protein